MEWLAGERPGGNVGDRRGTGRGWGRGGMGLVLIVIPMTIGGPAAGAEPPRAAAADPLMKLGRELFLHEWNPDDPRCHGGDGLGPVYNATSCVACHGLGGPGGAGPDGMNVEVISALGSELGFVGGQGITASGSPILPGGLVLNIPGIHGAFPSASSFLGIVHCRYSTADARGSFREGFVFSANGTTLRGREFELNTDPNGGGLVLSCAEGSLRAKSFTLKPDEEAMRKIHPALAAAPSAAIHLHGVDPYYQGWRTRLKNRIPVPRGRSDQGWWIPGGRILTSERNAPPLFGLGLIDALPEEVLIATARRERPAVRGRVSRTTSGRVGRFGWKAQTTDLREFVLAACANELGLEVPGHPQAASPLAPDRKAKGPDLSAEECDALIAYVRALPAPIQDTPYSPEVIKVGRHAFEEIGCADCHRPSLGGIEGIYSDLLLHDMGPDLVSVTVNPYYGPPEKVDMPSAASLADGTEWRTPPLWGYRDSGPYLHDGRAEDLAQVVKAHKGQALASATGFNRLSPHRRSLIERFLQSLAAPPPAPAPGAVADGEEAPRPRRSLLGPPTGRPPAGPAPAPMRADVVAREDGEHRSASRLRMARALERMGKPAGALEFYREIVRDAPGTDAARTAAARIKALSGEDGAAKEH